MEGLKDKNSAAKVKGQAGGRRSLRLGLGSGLSVLIVLAAVVFLGALAARQHLRWDLSEDAVHTLAPQTVKVLGSLKNPVRVVAFFRQGQPAKAYAQALLDRYAFACDKFSFRFVDPVKEPTLAKRYEIRNFGTLILTSGAKEERVDPLGEQSLTNALIRLQRKGQKTIYFLTGHGERSLDDKGKTGYSRLKKALEQQNFKVKSLILSLVKEAPKDAAALVAAGPRKPYTDKEKARLAAYLDQGGSLLVMIDPETEAGLDAWLKKRGVILGRDLVLDQASLLFGASPAWPVGAIYGKHPITEPMTGLFAYFPICRSVAPEAKPPAGVKAISLVKSTEKSWAETDFEALKKENPKVEYNKGQDQAGPISLAVAVSLPAPKGPKNGPSPAMAHLVVYGDSDFADNTHLEQAGNRDLVLNTLSFLVKEDDLVSIRPKSSASQPLLLTPWQAQLLFWVPVVLLPGFFLVLGLVVVLRRKRPAA